MKYFKSLQFVNETAKSITDENTKESIIDNVQKEEFSKLLGSGKKTKGRIKLKIEYIKNKVRRLTTFSKRKIGMMKKAYELAQLTGAQVMLLVGSETGHVYTFATNKLQPMVTSIQGKRLIESCLRDQNLFDTEATSQQGFSKESDQNEEIENERDSFMNSLLHEKPDDPINDLTSNNNIVHNLLAEPKGTLKKLYADINKQSKKGNCSMSINRHKIEHSPKLINILPQNNNCIIDVYNDRGPQKDVGKQKNLYNNINNGLLLNKSSNKKMPSYNKKNMHIFDSIEKATVQKPSSLIDTSNVNNNMEFVNGHDNMDFQVMVNPFVFNLLQANVFKNDEFQHDEIGKRTTTEAINLIKNK